MITALETISVDGEDFDDVGTVGGIFSTVSNGGVGNAGGVEITTANLSLTNGGTVSASTFGQGDAGTVRINASGTISIDGEDVEGFPGGIFSDVNGGGVGNAGGVEITTANLSLTNGGTLGASTFGQGNAGTVIINASGTIFVDGEDPSDETTVGGIASIVSSEGVGNAGGVEITTGNLSLTNGGVVTASTFGQGDAGTVTINASGTISVDGEDLEESNSGIASNVNSEAVGNAGGVNITTANLSLTNGGTLGASTFGQGDAGSINITATDTVTIEGGDSQGNNSGVFSAVSSDAIGNAGDINITAGSFVLKNEGQINSNILGEGSGGSIFLNVTDDLNLDNGQISATNQPPQPIANPEDREGGDIQLQVRNNLILRNNSTISAEATKNANGGNVNIDAGFVVGFASTGTGSDIRANAEQAIGGNINIITQGILGFEESKGTAGVLNDTNDIDASSEFGLDGVVIISSPDTNPLQATDRLPTNPVSAETVAAEACSPVGGETSLTYKGKGGIPPEPTAPFSADALIPDGKPITLDKETDLTSLLEGETETKQRDANYIPTDIKPIKTDSGDIYPARGIIKTEDGQIILTRYPTDNINPRTPHKSANCTPS